MPAEGVLKVALLGALTLIGAMIAFWLAGALYLGWAGLDISAARPWTWALYWTHYADLAGERARLLVCLVAPAALLLLALTNAAPGGQGAPPPSPWAHGLELLTRGLRAPSGVLLGAAEGDRLCDASEAHVVMIAPTGAGKTRGMIIPNCLAWPGGLVCYDPSGAAFAAAGAARALKGHVVCVRPLDANGRSHRFNPLDQLSTDPDRRLTEVASLAAVLFPVAPKDPNRWVDEGAQALFCALVEVLDRDARADPSAPPAAIGAVWTLAAAQADFVGWCAGAATLSGLSLASASTLSKFGASGQRHHDPIQSCLMEKLKPWAQARVRAATAVSDFRLSDLPRGALSVFIGAHPGDLAGNAQVIRVLIEAIAISLMRAPSPKPRSRFAAKPAPVLLVLDEFASVGDMAEIKNALAHARAYGVRILAACQTLAQLEDLYGRAGRDAELGHFGLQIFTAASDPTTLAYVADRLGRTRILRWSDSVSHGHDGPRRSRTRSDQEAPVMSADAIAALRPGKAIIFTPRTKPIRARIVSFERDGALMRRVGRPPSLPHLIAETPSQPRALGDQNRPPKRPISQHLKRPTPPVAMSPQSRLPLAVTEIVATSDAPSPLEATEPHLPEEGAFGGAMSEVSGTAPERGTKPMSAPRTGSPRPQPSRSITGDGDAQPHAQRADAPMPPPVASETSPAAQPKPAPLGQPESAATTLAAALAQIEHLRAMIGRDTPAD
jgi:type IV secretion system protein VirD4